MAHLLGAVDDGEVALGRVHAVVNGRSKAIGVSQDPRESRASMSGKFRPFNDYESVPRGRRLVTLAEAGRQKVPFTTGILIGIGETRAERIRGLLDSFADRQR